MEIEIKAKVNNLETIRRKLTRIAAKYVGAQHQIDTYYSLYKRPLGRKKGSLLRVRHNKLTNKARLEFHQPKNAYSAEETEVDVGDVKKIKKILQLMKAKQEFVIDKHRRIFKKGGVEVTLDKVKGIGTFVEVEIEGKDTKKNLKQLYRMLDMLGIKENQIVLHQKYHGMILKQKGKKHAYF